MLSTGRELESVSEDDPDATAESTVPEVDNDVDTVGSNTAAAASVVDVKAGGIDASVDTTDVAFDIADAVLCAQQLLNVTVNSFLRAAFFLYKCWFATW